MRPIALDTNTYAGFKRGDATCTEVVRHADQLLLSSTVAADCWRVSPVAARRPATARN